MTATISSSKNFWDLMVIASVVVIYHLLRQSRAILSHDVSCLLLYAFIISHVFGLGGWLPDSAL